MPIFELLLIAAAAFVITAATLPMIRRLAVRWQWLDVPNTRSSHLVPTARGGGVVIVVVTILCWMAMWSRYRFLPLRELLATSFASLSLAIISLVDDLRSLSSGLRLLLQAAAALLILFVLGGELLEMPPVSRTAAIAVAISVWIVGLTNAFNFMDGIDGIAGSQALLAALGWSVISLQQRSLEGLALSVLLGSTSLGFLLHNWPPARIFMGDVGSAFLGFCFAFMPLLIDPDDGYLYAAGVLLVWPFLFDTSLTLVRRARRRENLFVAHRSHLYQRLVIAGQSHRRVTLLYLTLASLGVLLAIPVAARIKYAVLLAATLISIGSVGLWVYVRRVETDAPR